MKKMRFGRYTLEKWSAEEYEVDCEALIDTHFRSEKQIAFVYFVTLKGKSVWGGGKMVEIAATEEIMVKFTDGTFGYTENYGYLKCRVHSANMLKCFKAMLRSMNGF